MLTLPDTGALTPNELQIFFPMGPDEYVEDGPLMRLDRHDIEVFTDADLDKLIEARMAPYRAAHPTWRIEARRAWVFAGLSGGENVIQMEPPAPEEPADGEGQ